MSVQRAMRTGPAGVAAGVLLALFAIPLACNDGARIFDEELERAPVLPRAPTARTSPVSDFTVEGSTLAFPPGGYGALGPRGLAVGRTDDGEGSSPGALEEGDALIADPSNHRVVLVKARVRGTGPDASVLSATGPTGALSGASAVTIIETDGAPRRILVATADGYAVLSADGVVVGAHAITGGPFDHILAIPAEAALFLVSGTTLRRVALTAGDTDFAPASAGGGSDLLLSGGPVLGGMAEGLNGDLLVTEPGSLIRVPDAAHVGAGSVVTLTAITFPAGEAARAVVLTSADRAAVAIDRTGVGSGPLGRVVEVLLNVTNQAPGSETSSVSLSAAPLAIAVDGRHGAFFVSMTTGLRPLLEAAPGLEERLQPLWELRGCTGCHPVVNAAIDLTNADQAFATMVNQTSATCGGTTYAVPGSAATSLLFQKLTGLRDGSTNASCGQRMPQALRPMPEVEVDAVRLWIDAGAVR